MVEKVPLSSKIKVDALRGQMQSRGYIHDSTLLGNTDKSIWDFNVLTLLVVGHDLYE